MTIEEQIKKIIFSYCDGITYYEFHIDDLDDIIFEIISSVYGLVSIDSYRFKIIKEIFYNNCCGNVHLEFEDNDLEIIVSEIIRLFN